MGNLEDILNNYSGLISIVGIFITLITGVGAGVGTEYHFNLINRVKKYVARFKNKEAEINLALRFKSNRDFDFIKTQFKNEFIKVKNYRLLRETTDKIVINFDVFTFEMIHDEFGDIFIDVFKMSLGVKELKLKVEHFLSIIDTVNEKSNILSKFVSCDMSLQLPYKWNFKIYEPSGFKLEDFTIKMSKKDGFKTYIEIHIDTINVYFKSLIELNPLLEKLL